MALRDVVGHESQRRLLARLVARGRLPHALLIEGVPGCGRRTLARALAAALLCATPRDGDACGECRACALTAAGTHPDLVELPHDADGAPAPAVEQVRDEVANASSETPLAGDRRVFVVYGIERLRGEAANALLKVLEEPPPGTFLLMTAASASAVLATIRSRAQQLRLQPLSVDELARVLVRGGVDAPAAQGRARAGAGSHRGLWRIDDAAPPLDALRRLLDAGFDSAAVADAVAELPTKEPKSDEGVERTLAAEQRRVARRWLEQLVQALRADLRGADPAAATRAAERIDRVLAAQRDLARNFQPRSVIESLALPLRG